MLSHLLKAEVSMVVAAQDLAKSWLSARMEACSPLALQTLVPVFDHHQDFFFPNIQSEFYLILSIFYLFLFLLFLCTSEIILIPFSPYPLAEEP